MKAVTDTTVNIEDANIIANDINITVNKGVGVTGGTTLIELSSKPVTLTSAERVALAAAERSPKRLQPGADSEGQNQPGGVRPLRTAP